MSNTVIVSPSVVVHRIDDLEKRPTDCCRSRHVVHRIDDLETTRSQLTPKLSVVHRIDDLEKCLFILMLGV